MPEVTKVTREPAVRRHVIGLVHSMQIQLLVVLLVRLSIPWANNTVPSCTGTIAVAYGLLGMAMPGAAQPVRAVYLSTAASSD